MNRKISLYLAGAIAAALLPISLISNAAHQPPPGAGQGSGGFGQRGGRGLTLADMPVSSYADDLNLTAEQKTKITAIRNQYKAQTKDMVPQPGTPPDQTMRDKMNAIRTETTKSIEALLSEDQKAKLPEVSRFLGSLRRSGVPLEVLGKLKITAEQKAQLVQIQKDAMNEMQGVAPEDRRTKGREIMTAASEKTNAVFNADQKAMIDKYNKEHPRPQFGRPPGGPGAPAAPGA